MRMICFALLALLVSSGAAFSQAARPRGRVVVLQFGPRHLILPRYHTYYCPFPYPVPYAVSYPVANVVSPSPDYVFAGTVSESHPQLVFKDGVTYAVTDYWRKDDQLHFITSEEGGSKFVPHIVPFGDLDVQRTTDANEARGFRFVVRDEPIDQWLDHHSQHR